MPVNTFHYSSLVEFESSSANFQAGQQSALALFHRVAEEVPAYRDFLQKNGVHHDHVQSPADFVHLPITTKENYIGAYSLIERCWGGKNILGGVLYASSGTTGNPTLWFRQPEHDRTAVFYHEFLLKKFYNIENKRTLFIDCFAMGIHVAGFITASSLQEMAKTVPGIFLATPGSKREDIVSLLFSVSNFFDQVVLIGYPPMIKTVVEDALGAGFDWTQVRVHFLFAAQGFSEKWRKHLRQLVGDYQEESQILSIYGSADVGPMAVETPLTVKIRQMLEYGIAKLDFGLPHLQEGPPYLFQYFSTLRHFEAINQELVVTANNGVPLIRYNIHDVGGVKGDHLEFGMFRLASPLTLPLVYLYGRKNSVVIFYGANIYPEHVHSVLQDDFFFSFLSGNFFLEVKEDEHYTQKLFLLLELKSGLESVPHDPIQVKNFLANRLCAINKEFLVVFQEMQNQKNVAIEFHPHSSGIFAPTGAKQKYVQSSYARKN